MKFTKLTYARVFNTGNYENQRIELECELQADDDPLIVLALMKTFVFKQRPGVDSDFATKMPQTQ
jgi:hypothetical protein